MGNYLEKDLEAEIEEVLCASGYHTIKPDFYDRELCLIKPEVIDFIKETQPKEYEKLNIQQEFNSSVDLSKETQELLEYLEHGTGQIESEFYNKKEKIHLEEVRQIYITIQLIINIAFILSILTIILLFMMIRRIAARMSDHEFSIYIKRLVSHILIAAGAVVDGLAVLFGMMMFTFSSSFTLFHELFFRTDTWILDPATDNLVRMLPEQFFFDIFVRIVLMSVVFATILLVIGFLIKLGRPSFLRQKR